MPQATSYHLNKNILRYPRPKIIHLLFTVAQKAIGDYALTKE